MEKGGRYVRACCCSGLVQQEECLRRLRVLRVACSIWKRCSPSCVRATSRNAPSGAECATYCRPQSALAKRSVVIGWLLWYSLNS